VHEYLKRFYLRNIINTHIIFWRLVDGVIKPQAESCKPKAESQRPKANANPKPETRNLEPGTWNRKTGNWKLVTGSFITFSTPSTFQLNHPLCQRFTSLQRGKISRNIDLFPLPLQPIKSTGPFIVSMMLIINLL